MSNAYNNIFAKTKCPSEDVLLKYIKGRTEGSEKRAVELHISDCEMCSDFVDGLAEMQDAEDIKSIVEEINENIDKQLQTKKRAFPSWLKVAAGFILLSSISVLLYNLTKDHLSTIKEVPLTMEKEAPEDASMVLLEIEEQDSKQARADTAEALPPPLPSSEDITILKDEADFFDKDVIVVAEATHDMIEEKSLPLAPASEETTAIASDESSEIYAKDISGEALSSAQIYEQQEREVLAEKSKRREYFSKTTAPVIEAEEKAEESITPFDLAVREFDNGHYSKALSILNTLQKNDTVSFYKGMAHYHLEDFRQAITELKELQNKTHFVYAQHAQWYNALAHIKAGDTAKAKDILENIVNRKGPFASPALEKLEKLKER